MKERAGIQSIEVGFELLEAGGAVDRPLRAAALQLSSDLGYGG